jgi:chitinase
MPRSSSWHGFGRGRSWSFLNLVLSFSALLWVAQRPGAAEEPSAAGHPRIVGYFPGDGARKNFLGKDLVARGAVSVLDQINYSQGHVAGSQCAVADPVADLSRTFSADNSVDGTADAADAPLRGNFHQLQELKKLYPNVKLLISLEGNAELFAEAAQPGNRHAFVASCIERFIQGKFAEGIEGPGLFDGIDLDWEYPREVDKLNFIALLGEFRRQLNSAGSNLLLSAAMGDGRVTYQHLDMKAVALYVDEVGVMNYDYSGPWSKRTGLIAPLYSSPGDPEKNNDVDSTIRGYEAMGVPPEKILLGLPFYAYSWNQVTQDNHGLFQMGEPSRTDLPYNYIVSILDKFTTYRDPRSLAPWLYDGSTFWTYDDELSIGAKLKYAKQEALGGVMIWELSGDTAEGRLLKTISTQMKDRDKEDGTNEDDDDDATSGTP